VAVVLVTAQVVLAEPPVASFTPVGPVVADPGELVAFQSTTPATDADGDTIASIVWDFGDGTPTATGPSVSHAYVTPGTYTVQMTVTDSANEVSDPATATVRVNAAPIAEIAPLGTAQIGQAVTFDGSGSSDPDGTIATYEWDLDGNGSFETNTGTVPTASRSYPSADTSIIVQLRVTDNDGAPGAIAFQTLRVNAPPSASLTAAPNPVQTGQPITFSGSGSDTDGTIATYQWDFDNNGTFDATGQNLSHTYTTAGTRTVRLQVTDNDGGIATDTDTVTVTDTPPPNIPPQASFRASPASPFTGDLVTLSSTSSDPDGPLVSQDWDTDNDGQFDDASGPVASRSFPGAGAQTVRLRVVDAHGVSAIAVGRVDVRARLIPPPPPPPPPPPLAVLNSNVTISGRFSNSSTTIGRMLVKAPAGAQIAPACKGRGCPKRVKKLRAKAAAKRLRVRAFERRWRPGAKITIRVTKPGFIGTHTQFTIRRGKRPKRTELCVQPAAKRASACPRS
jgi:PKD repeat protein